MLNVWLNVVIGFEPVYINTSPASRASLAPDKCIYISTSPAPEKCIFKYFSGCFSGAGKVYLNISLAPEKHFLSDISPAPEKPGTYLKTPFRRRISIYTLSGAGEVLIYTHLAPERHEKPEKYLYTPALNRWD